MNNESIANDPGIPRTVTVCLIGAVDPRPVLHGAYAVISSGVL